MEKVDTNRFVDMMVKAEQSGKMFSLDLSPLEVTGLHGAIVLAMKHPHVASDMHDLRGILQRIRHKLCLIMEDIGFTEEEVKYLDTKEV